MDKPLSERVAEVLALADSHGFGWMPEIQLLREQQAEIERLRFREEIFTDEGGSVAGGKTIAERERDRAVKAETERDRLRAENDALRADAARYNQLFIYNKNSWLPAVITREGADDTGWNAACKEEADAILDAIRSQS